jgi:glycosyltransferase involved in cell wall biosynthesis
MPPITALLHTANDALRLGRTLETLLPCSEILLIDHHSSDATRRIARQYGARIVSAEADGARRYLDLARHDWILCLQPGESITESLQASLFEWSAFTLAAFDGVAAFSLFVRQQTGEHWLHLPAPETRLIPRSWTRWHGLLPSNEPSAIPLEGELLRFDLP